LAASLRILSMEMIVSAFDVFVCVGLEIADISFCRVNLAVA
jgi:hypothetical protein